MSMPDGESPGARLFSGSTHRRKREGTVPGRIPRSEKRLQPQVPLRALLQPANAARLGEAGVLGRGIEGTSGDRAHLERPPQGAQDCEELSLRR